MVEEAEPGDRNRPWTDVFRKSRLCPAVFNLTPEGEDDVSAILNELGLPSVRTGIMFSSSNYSTALLDGWVSSFYPYGFPAGRLGAGTRVIGYRPFRLLCHLLDLRPPRRLKGEPRVPPVEELLGDMEKQKSLSPEVLKQMAMPGLVEEMDSLRALVFTTYGEAVGPMDDRTKQLVPGRGDWGKAGLTRAEEEAAERLGVPIAEAVEWKAMRAFGRDFVGLHPHGLAEVRRWIELGIPPHETRQYLDRGYTIEQVLPYLQGGVHPQFAHYFIEPGCTAEEAAAYFRDGLTLRQAMDLADVGVSAKEGQRWIAAGMTTHDAALLVRRGWTPEQLESRTEAERHAALEMEGNR